MGSNQSSKSSCWLGACALVAVFCAPACSASSSGPAPITLQELPGRLADAYCDNIAACCQTASIAFDSATCKANITSTVGQSLAATAGPNVTYDANAAGDCVAAYASELKSCSFDDVALTAACTNVFVGKLSLGTACGVDAECKSSPSAQAFCDQGFCALLHPPDASVHGTRGQACAESCTVGGDCSGTGLAGTDAAPTAICYGSDGLYCSAAQTCQPFAGLGEPCSDGGCIAGAFCHVDVCVSLLADGAACEDDTQCVHKCISDPSATGLSGTCGTVSVASTDSCAGNLL